MAGKRQLPAAAFDQLVCEPDEDTQNGDVKQREDTSTTHTSSHHAEAAWTKSAIETALIAFAEVVHGHVMRVEALVKIVHGHQSWRKRDCSVS